VEEKDILVYYGSILPIVVERMKMLFRV